jgi:hypothetical protein
MQITELSPTRFDLPGRAAPVYIATQRWALEPWKGEDPPDLGRSWAIKPKFAVGGNRSCAELAIVHHLRGEGWHGVWVCAYGPAPIPAVRARRRTSSQRWPWRSLRPVAVASSGPVSCRHCPTPARWARSAR